jgi:hypothetical protein
VGVSLLVSGTIIAASLLITSFQISKARVVTYDLLFRRWPRLEIERIVSEIAATLTAADDECYVYIAELCKLVSLVN